MDCEQTPYTPNAFQIAFEQNQGIEWEKQQLQSVPTGPHRFPQEISEDTSGLMDFMESATTTPNTQPLKVI